jgi:hypothetical protein
MVSRKSERAILLAEFRPLLSDFLKVWFGLQTTTAFPLEPLRTCEPFGTRFPLVSAVFLL